MAQPLYQTINMNTFPGEMKLKGKTVKQQAINVNYQDIPRDIQVMRDQEYAQEVKDGQFSPEFSGLSDIVGNRLLWVLVAGAGILWLANCKCFKM